MFREHLKLSQKDFSEQIGISRERLATYEEGRAPLRCDIALRICRVFYLSEAWLAEGRLDFSAPLKVSSGISRLSMGLEMESIARQLRPDLRFSEAFAGPLKDTYYRTLMEHFPAPKISLLESDRIETYENALIGSLSYWRETIPTELWVRMYSNLVMASVVIWKELSALDGFDEREMKSTKTSFEMEIEERIKKLQKNS